MQFIFKVQREKDGMCRIVKAKSKKEAVASAFPIRIDCDTFWVLNISSDGKLERCTAPARVGR